MPCPQTAVTLTCITSSEASTSLTWTHDGGLDIAELLYVFVSTDEYPLPLNRSSVGITDYTIVNASSVDSTIVFRAELVIDLDVLYNDLGYRSLECGSPGDEVNFTFVTELDIEGSYELVVYNMSSSFLFYIAPLAFKIKRVDLFYNATSPSSIEELVIRTERPVSSCMRS